MSEPYSHNLTAVFESTLPLRAIFGDQMRIQRMLDVEAALARVQARLGVVPATAVDAICVACNAQTIDIASLAIAAAAAGNLAIPLVKQLTASVAKSDAEAAKYVHWGATSQDIIDTALILQLRDALTHIERDLQQLGDLLAKFAKQHQSTPLAGRTWMQQALPITLGLKAATWLDPLQRHRTRIDALKSRLLVLQFGGAAGTLASLGDAGLQVAQALATELKLALPALPWHATRDRVVELASVLGAITGSLGKIARDISLLAQSEIAELAEPHATGRGGSSAMPHKRNPVACANVLAAATRMPGLVATMLTAMPQENERALGGWQAEWECLPQIVQLTGAALEQMLHTVAGLQVDAARMHANLHATDGLIMAESVTLELARTLGRPAAYDLVEKVCQQAVVERRHLRDVLASQADVIAILSPEKLDALFDPLQYTGQARIFVERAVQAWRAYDGVHA
jgi:3-carboxy-cis,cis-muconate cycloisomerase